MIKSICILILGIVLVYFSSEIEDPLIFSFLGGYAIGWVVGECLSNFIIKNN